ncbi:MAG: UDP-2,3-diacylglucosamine diphosphatase [Bacteroidales bacterium]|nr:MAG: UDP-2,3-diacylglucosamine diphosphatase [Bacteroidales bacterium]
MPDNKKIYFASDIHLGYPNHEQSLLREKRFVKWLEEVRSTAREIYLLGDIFDYWYEYKKVVPRGFTRLLGKIAEITDEGIPIHFFTGNHDIWIFDYLPMETGVTVHHQPVQKTYHGLKYYIAHGDGLGPCDKGYKLLKKIYTSRTLQLMFSRLHPNFTIWFAHKWSHKSRSLKELASKFEGEEKECLIQYARDLLTRDHFDFFIFGHRHIPLDIHLDKNCRFIYLGDWLTHFTYAIIDGEKVELKKYDE